MPVLLHHGRVILAPAVRRHPTRSRPRRLESPVRDDPAHAGDGTFRASAPRHRRHHRATGSRAAPATVRLDASVVRVSASAVTLSDGEPLRARAVVVATEGPEAHQLLGERAPDPGSRAAGCCWFAVRDAPLPGRLLVLDGEASGPMKNLAVVSEVCPSYAPAGRGLVAAAVPGPDALDPAIGARVRDQLARWFGTGVGEWEHLRTDVIPHGQPAQAPPLHPKQRVALGDGSSSAATIGTRPRYREPCSVASARRPR